MADLQKLISGLLSGDKLSLSKCITLVESDAIAHQEEKFELIKAIENLEKNTFRLAVTGVPGAGKSTLIDKLGIQWLEQGNRVAVLAVDPTSSISQGSVLGDKTRMAELAKSEKAFIRPSPTRLQLGGIAAHTFETILLCEAAGFDRIIIETVGVGQSETLASQLSDACLLVLVSGTGDEIQGLKKGILEAADFIFVNKADGPFEKTAKSYAKELESMNSLWPLRRNGEFTKVMFGSAIENTHLPELGAEINLFFQKVKGNGQWDAFRVAQKKDWLNASWKEWAIRYLSGKEWVKSILESVNQGFPEGESVSSVLEKLRKEVMGRL